MSEGLGRVRLIDLDALMAYLGVDSLAAVAAVISDETDPDAYLVAESGQVVLRMGTRGSTLEFPMTVDDFWDLVHDLEDEVISE